MLPRAVGIGLRAQTAEGIRPWQMKMKEDEDV
jgi:hypothetical protein